MAEQNNKKKKQDDYSEESIMDFWKDNEIYKFDENSDKPLYSIDTPPPTVSGKMHMGHAFGNSQQDFIARYKRMKGFNVLQPFGTDDNGLPTKLLIEKTKKVKASKMPRTEFVQLVLKTLKEDLRPRYLQDWKRLGISCDFSITYTTINEHSQRISQKSFIELYKKSREYRAEAAAMYCPKCQTAISQVECEDKEVHSHFNDIIFKTEGKDIIIATTRPELLPACVAVFVNPEDKRFTHLVEKKATVPLFNFEVPIIADERADPEKGTGIVMCCTFGDLTDTEWQKAHNLPIKEAISRHGKMTELAGKYEGMKIDEARKEIINDLKESNLLVKQEPITHTVNAHERCGTPIEFVHSKQWFIKYLDLKDDMLEWGNQMKWLPHHMKNRYDNWVKGLQWDWCISRQLPYGVPFPVWYCENCDEVILAEEKQLPIDPTENSPLVKKCPKCGHERFRPETDIINTWATSSLTPTIVKELFKGKPIYDKLISKPMDLRPQGHDIISFWLFNTVVKSQLHFNMKPWNVCFINGWMLDPKGKKMAKSKGNIIEPIHTIEKYGADALRYMAGSVKLGEDLPFPEKDVVTGKKTITKLKNASRFVFMNLEDYKNEKINMQTLKGFNKWMLIKLSNAIKESTDGFEEYQFSVGKMATNNVFWHSFCDNYLEIVKDTLYNGTDEEKIPVQYVLYTTLRDINKLFAPIMPFITEYVWQKHFRENEGVKSIHISDWPELSLKDEDVEKKGDELIELISNVRKEKSDNKKSLKTSIKLTIPNIEKYEEFLPALKSVTKAEEIVEGEFKVEFLE